MFSQIALKLYALKKEKVIKSNAQFWREFNNVDKIAAIDVDIQKYTQELNENGVDLICVFDEEFPNIPTYLKSSEKPYLFAYKGDIASLKDITKNIAVVGVLTPTQDIIERERKLVQNLVKKQLCIVSGLANGCDTIAHKECLINVGKTIAVLPTTIENIYPKKNAELADKIVQGGGLVITEYVTEPMNRFESVKRFIERDRLQAIFAGRIILIASYLQGQGDSGSRHAMSKANEYGRERFVMYNEQTDRDKPIFGLNESLIAEGTTILTPKVLNEFKCNLY